MGIGHETSVKVGTHWDEAQSAYIADSFTEMCRRAWLKAFGEESYKDEAYLTAIYKPGKFDVSNPNSNAQYEIDCFTLSTKRKFYHIPQFIADFLYRFVDYLILQAASDENDKLPMNGIGFFGRGLRVLNYAILGTIAAVTEWVCSPWNSFVKPVYNFLVGTSAEATWSTIGEGVTVGIVGLAVTIAFILAVAIPTFGLGALLAPVLAAAVSAVGSFWGTALFLTAGSVLGFWLPYQGITTIRNLAGGDFKEDAIRTQILDVAGDKQSGYDYDDTHKTKLNNQTNSEAFRMYNTPLSKCAPKSCFWTPLQICDGNLENAGTEPGLANKLFSDNAQVSDATTTHTASAR